MKQSIFETSEAPKQWEGTISKKRRSFHWFSRNSELEATWISLIGWPHKTSIYYTQSYVIKSAPWTILWFRILGIFSVENIKRLCAFMFQTCSNSQLLRRVLWISAEQTIGASLKHKNTQPLYIFSRVRVLHLNRLKERTWLHSFDIYGSPKLFLSSWGKVMYV